MSPREVTQEPKLSLLLSADCPQRLVAILAIDNTNSVSSPNLDSLPFSANLPTFFARFDYKGCTGCFTICSHVASELWSTMYSIFSRTILHLSTRTAKPESASASNLLALVPSNNPSIKDRATLCGRPKRSFNTPFTL